VVLGHFGPIACDGREAGVVVGVVAVLFDLLSALLVGVLTLLALPPEEETCKDQQGNNDNGDYDGNRSLSSSTEATAVV
jgi:hypothetical protein